VLVRLAFARIREHGSHHLLYRESPTTGADGSLDRHAYLVARTSDQSAGTIAEKAVTFTTGAYAEASSVMKVHQIANSFTDGRRAIWVETSRFRIDRLAGRPQPMDRKIPTIEALDAAFKAHYETKSIEELKKEATWFLDAIGKSELTPETAGGYFVVSVLPP